MQRPRYALAGQGPHRRSPADDHAVRHGASRGRGAGDAAGGTLRRGSRAWTNDRQKIRGVTQTNAAGKIRSVSDGSAWGWGPTNVMTLSRRTRVARSGA